MATQRRHPNPAPDRQAQVDALDDARSERLMRRLWAIRKLYEAERLVRHAYFGLEVGDKEEWLYFSLPAAIETLEAVRLHLTGEAA